jgi:Mrp family chromosome partitioning ATPase
MPRTAAPDLSAASIAPEPQVQQLNEIERLARDLCAAGTSAKKVAVLGTAAGEAITLTALTLARLMAREAKVVLVDLAASSPMMASVSADAGAPGLAELMQGEASFTQVITKDRFSRVQLVNAGRPGFARSLMQSPRLSLALDALLRVYDHVLLDAGTAADLPAELLTAHARAVVVPDPGMKAPAREQMAAELKAAGFSAVAMLSKPCLPDEETLAPPHVVAA